MAINPALLVTDNTLQEYLVDKATGLPLAAGIVTFYQDNSRTTLKNVYYLSGSPNNYTYITLPNPLTLSAVGTVVDVNGNDTKIFYYPYSETDNTTLQPYYITVDNSQGTRQFTRQDFPFVSNNNTIQSNQVINNLLINGSFWRNGGQSTSTAITLTNATNQVICPSAHAGFTATIGTPASNITTCQDMTFFKSATGAVETMTFSKFPAGSFLTTSGTNPPNQDVAPFYYLNFTCTNSGAETFKYIQIPIALKQKNLEQTDVTLTFWARCNSGTNTIVPSILQYNGTGGTGSAVTKLQSQTLNINWRKCIISFTMPAATDAVSSAGDDGWFLQLNYPLGSAFNIDIVKPSFYVGNVIPTNDFQDYDQIESIINSPRTGDVRSSLNTFNPFGWVRCDGTIGNASSNSSYAATDAWPLYNLIWQQFNNVQLNGSNYIPILTSGGGGSTYGASAFADWNANKQLSLTPAIGQTILGASVSKTAQNVTNFNTGTNYITVSSSSSYFNSMPIMFTNAASLPSGLAINTIYYVINLGGAGANTFQVASSYANFLSSTAVALGIAGGAGTSQALVNIAGTSTGEYQHTQLLGELVSHNHPPIGGITNFITLQGGGTAEGTGAANWGAPNNTGNTGGGSPFNITQPSVFYNVFLKL